MKTNHDLMTASVFLLTLFRPLLVPSTLCACREDSCQHVLGIQIQQLARIMPPEVLAEVAAALLHQQANLQVAGYHAVGHDNVVGRSSCRKIAPRIARVVLGRKHATVGALHLEHGSVVPMPQQRAGVHADAIPPHFLPLTRLRVVLLQG